MTSSLRILCWALLVAAVDARAQSAYQTRVLPPGGWDLRFGVEADVLLTHAGANASAEVGVVPLGDGTLAAGLEAAVAHCVLRCGSAAGVEVERWATSPMARVAWHYLVGGETPNVAEIDLYAVALGGAGFVLQEAQRGTASLSSTSIVPLVGLGLGSAYFPGNGDVVFAGGELRVLYSQATQGLEGSPDSGLVLTPWSLAGVRFMFTMGVRL